MQIVVGEMTCNVCKIFLRFLLLSKKVGLLVSTRLCSGGENKETETLMAAPSSSLFLASVKLASRALVQAVTQRPSLPPLGRNNSHMASKSYPGRRKRRLEGVSAVNCLRQW